MLNPENFIVTFARAVELFRTMPDAVPEQKAALRALVALTKLDGATIRFDGRELRVSGELASNALPNIPELIVQLQEHKVMGIEVFKDAAPAELLALLRGLAAFGGEGPLPQGETVRVTLLVVSTEVEAVSLSDEMEQIAQPVQAAPSVDQEPAVAAPPVTQEPAETHDEVHYFPGVGLDEEEGQSLEAALGTLDADPYSGDILNQLTPIATAIKELLEHDKLERAMPAVATLVELEQNAPDEDIRRAYGIGLLRLFEGNLLEKAADMLMDVRFRDGAAQVLARARQPAFEILHKRLDAAVDVEEARTYARVMTPIVDDVGPLLPLLDHQRWPVAESAANVIGNVGHERAVPALVRATDHSDARVRRAAMMALSKIGNKEAIEHMLRAVGSEDEALRSAVTSGVRGRKSSALAMPILKVADESNSKPEVRRDCYEALGRIGTPEAIQGLFTAAEPGGRILGRKSSEQRVAAINGLKQADDPRMAEKLARFVADKDKAVRDAAAQAISELRERAKAEEEENSAADDN